MAASVFKGSVEFDGAVTFDGTVDYNSTQTFDAAVDFDSTVDLTGATVALPTAAMTGTAEFDGAVNFDGAVDFDSTVDLSGATVTYPTAQITPAAILATAVSPAANAACAILNTTTEINLTVTDGTNTAISTTSSVPGQRIVIIAASVAGGGSYTLALVSGTLTLNATGETAEVVRNQAGTGWRAVALTAGVAGGSAATVV